MLYPRNMSKALEHDLFKNPTSEYRGAPFWSWNCKLQKDLILSQIEVFKEMGFGGFHIHARTGLDTQYLGDEFMDFVALSNEKAKEEGMLCWLYDEDRFPSGFAGGFVTEDLRFRARHLLLSMKEYNEFEKSKEEFDKRVEKGEKPKGYYLASYLIVLDGNNCLKEYKRIERNEIQLQSNGKGNIWHAYVRLSEEETWYNGNTYVDVLNRKAIEKFIEVTYERYFNKVGQDFGKSIPAIFTDEPQVSRKSTLRFAGQKSDVTISFTDDLPDTYYKEYKQDLLDVLPELFWQLPDNKVSLVRYRYHDHVTERFVSAFSDTLGEWCEKHNIALTGHLMSERTLFSQTIALGEAMRHFRKFQLPGMDILCDAKEFSTAKQAVSVARQYGREGVTSELYGVTHWYFDFKGHKLQGDWQAALGVTIRVPHLAYMSMEGEAKRDWPASINYQSPWYKEYSYIENHFARLNTVLTRGRPEVKVGVIHPIESYWLIYGPNDQTGVIRDQYDKNFEDFISWMLYGLIDFDFISESLFPELCTDGGTNPIKVGCMSYDTIIVPDCRTLRKTTVERLEAFRAAGGRVIFAGNVPEYMDAVPTDRIKALAGRCEQIPFNRAAVLSALEKERSIEVRLPSGKLADNLVHQIRVDSDGCKWLFLCHVERKWNKVDEAANYTIKIKGKYRPIIYDTITGDISSCPAVIEGENTVITRKMYGEDSLLLRLEEGVPEIAPVNEDLKLRPVLTLEDPVDYVLSEPNVLLLDRAEYAFDGGDFNPAEEILRIDNIFREKLGYPKRWGNMAQPWTVDDNGAAEHTLTLRFTIMSDVDVKGARLAIENPVGIKIFVNSKRVDANPDGYFTDRSIKTVPIPELNKGKNEIIIEIPFGRKTNVEWCYLLGDFGVRVAGSHAYMERAPEKLAFGDWVPQGLAFYAGNVTYKCSFTLRERIDKAVLEIPHFSAPVIAVSLDGERKGLIAFAPHRLSIGSLEAGSHTLDITVYGNRYNSFGTLHNADDQYMWYGPQSYRTTGSQWTDSYLLKPMGVLSKPVIYSED